MAMSKIENLYALSWEHGSWLLFVRKIKNKLNDGNTVEQIKYFILDEWNNSLEHHLIVEETIFEPVMLKYVPDTPMIMRMRKDHDRIRSIIWLLKNDKAKIANITEFAELLLSHINFENNELFPDAELHIPTEELNKLRHSLKSEIM